MLSSIIPSLFRGYNLAAAFVVVSTVSLIPQTAGADAVFTWVKGPQATEQPGVFAGAPATLNPGARDWPATWRDLSGKLWLFGGYGHTTSAVEGYLNDLWVYDPATNNWTFAGGSMGLAQNGSHGTIGIPSSSNIPGARWGAAYWVGQDGRLWLFGGYGYDDFGAQGNLNDLMVFDPATLQWTWVSGSNAVNDAGVPGSGPTAVPSARHGVCTAVDSSGTVWLYGGYGRLVLGFDVLSDLWSFNPVTAQWALVHGSNVALAATHGTKGVAAPSNTPGSRAYVNHGWIDAAGTFNFFGGHPGIPGAFANDQWRFDPVSGMWTWIHGSDLLSQPGNYGTMGVPADTNIPGARAFTSIWNDQSGQVWLFGGRGRDSLGLAATNLGDLWKYNTGTNQWTFIKGSVLGEAPGVWGTQGVAAETNIPSARHDYGTWITADGLLWLFGGVGTGIDEYSDLWKLAVNYTADVSVTLAASSAGIILGQTVTYTGQITNNGPDHAQNVVATMSIGGEPLEFNPQLAPGITASAVPGSVTFNIALIAPGQTVPVSATVTPTVPATVQTSLQLGPSSTDPIPANNAAAVDVQVVQGDGPDLIVGGSATHSCRVTRSGTRCRIRTTAVVTNSGNQDALQSSLRVFLSDDGILDPADQQLREVGVRKLRIGRSNTKRITTNLPTGTSASGKYVIIQVDAGGIIAEGNEFNNKTVFGPIP